MTQLLGDSRVLLRKDGFFDNQIENGVLECRSAGQLIGTEAQGPSAFTWLRRDEPAGKKSKAQRCPVKLSQTQSNPVKVKFDATAVRVDRKLTAKYSKQAKNGKIPQKGTKSWD
jgi:hypothetical protein